MSYAIWGDWGTTRLRLFRVEKGRVVSRAYGPGVSQLSLNPADTLRTAIAPWLADGLPKHILLCGMVGSRMGLVEVDYAPCPSNLAQWLACAKRQDFDGVPLIIAPGIACENINGAPDIMRGEETQVFGALSAEIAPHLAQGRHLIALPGTHSKWARIENGAVLRFLTFPTGELFALLRMHSTLVHGTTDEPGFEDGFEDGLLRANKGKGLLSSAFEARSSQLRLGKSSGWAVGFLSGLLIGHEISEVLALLFEGVEPTLIGDERLVRRYMRALASFGISSQILDGDACALAGLALLEGCL